MRKVNRNDECWCGSGQKYKKCHLDHDERLDQFKREGYPIPPRKIIKTPEQIAGIREACQLTARILDELTDIVQPGITTDEINTWVHTQVTSAGAIPATLNYRGYPKSCCTSLNEVICHGIPDDTVLKNGDILNVDITSILNGYYGDSCRMYSVGSISSQAQKLVDVTKECLYKAIDAVKPFNTLNDIGRAIETHAHANGYSVVEMFGGHGVGVEFHEDPFVFHYERDEKDMVLVPNMTFTIEPMINAGKQYGKILGDGWTAVTKDGSLSAQWEHTVCVTETGAEVLTRSPQFS